MALVQQIVEVVRKVLVIVIVISNVTFLVLLLNKCLFDIFYES